MRPRAAVDQMQRATPHRWGLLVAVGAVTAVDMEVVLEAAVPAVEGSGKGGTFHLNVHPVTAGTGRHVMWEDVFLSTLFNVDV